MTVEIFPGAKRQIGKGRSRLFLSAVFAFMGAPLVSCISDPEPVPDPATKEKPVSRKREGGDRVSSLRSFEKGAAEDARTRNGEDFPTVMVEEGLLRKFDLLASKSRIADIVKEDYRWMACIFRRLISDDETVALVSFTALRDICRKRNISSKSDRFVNPINMAHFYSKTYRADIYGIWAGSWWPTNREFVAGWNSKRSEK